MYTPVKGNKDSINIPKKDILLGKSSREIGQTLQINENTMKTHVRNVFSKFGVSSRAELIGILLKSR